MSGAAPLYAVTPTSSKMKEASRKFSWLANASNVWVPLMRPAARAAAVKAASRSIAGRATRAEPRAARRNLTCAFSSCAISYAYWRIA